MRACYGLVWMLPARHLAGQAAAAAAVKLVA